jgi:hypothetical protein
MHRITAPQSEQAIVNHFNALLDNLNSALMERHVTRDFSPVFEKYIRG